MRALNVVALCLLMVGCGDNSELIRSPLATRAGTTGETLGEMQAAEQPVYGDMLVCDVQQATMSVKSHSYAENTMIPVNGSFGVTFVLAIDPAGRKLTLISLTPLSGWRGDTYRITYKPLPDRQLRFDGKLSQVEVGFDPVPQGTLDGDGVITGMIRVGSSSKKCS